ncbi:hypothetical protein OVA14_01950 [Agrococcus sp. SL85]|uniref:hypothetical protein n=1 Tax=Agrococcus sp. SL85 TaxID=2995141 RepID=UPI00226CA212|nr:hypothetical protein [Agrococcus sp. SL85]WAC66571.1 hypothetical protein OVA14_01950 [Agrococcus sp. SL85]
MQIDCGTFQTAWKVGTSWALGRAEIERHADPRRDDFARAGGEESADTTQRPSPL